ncbi:hypothetical protein NDU88_003474 [Pleurodeles waltl]|uniref:Putative malate dehydrogenase 1B n=1 Tax=Pleurodeles waltl TaxID=8319 RepID=A0AAV7UCM7_PLEWA|nr:hypothetical protein NDU88_003474 [Pleurodeles waltl]
MAKFVLAGKADCPYFAKAELLADYLQKNLPNFRVHKITHHPDDWELWLQSTCEKNGWKHTRSPIVWRELVDRGGKGLLLGGFNEFMEHAQHYYFNTSNMMTDLMLKIGEENLNTHIEIKKEEDELRSLINPLEVWITSASTPSCYSLLPMLASGEVFGIAQDISIHLLDSSDCEDTLQALVLEAEDLAFPLLRNVTMHTVSEETFLLADVIIVLDDVSFQENQSVEDCVSLLEDQCKEYGNLIELNASPGVKVIVAGDTFVNLKALVIMSHAPSIPKHNVIAVATLLEFEAKAQLAKKLKVNAAVVKDVIVWGNISGVNFLDLHLAKVYHYDSAIWGPPSYSRPLLEVIYDSKWLQNEFLLQWTSRKQHRRGMTAAYTTATILRYWYQGSPPGEIVSLGVISEGQFGIPEGIVFSMPVRFQEGKWEVLLDMAISDQMKEKLLEASTELIKEKNIALLSPQESEPLPEPEQASDTQQENIFPNQQEAGLAVPQDSGMPAYSSSFLPFRQGSARIASEGNVPETQEEHVFLTPEDDIRPVQRPSVLLTQKESALPDQERTLSVQQESLLPAQSQSALPIQQEDSLQTDQERGLPTQQESTIPGKAESKQSTDQENELTR